MSGLNGLIVLFVGAVALVLLLMMYGLFLMFNRMKKLTGKESDRSNMGFVVDTFHSLMAQLKQKEQELQELREKAEQRAGIAEDYNENILQSVPSGVVSLDNDWHIVKLNSSARRILQLRGEDLVGSDARESLSEFCRSGSMEDRGQLSYRTRAGRKLWLSFSLTPLVDSSGQNIGMLLVFTDLTELKALEDQAELRQRLSSLGEMAAGIAHELRNPMGVIAGYMRLLSKKASPDLKGTVDQVSREVGDMERIISDFLTFARPGEPSYADVSLKPLIDDCFHSALPEGGNVRATVSIDGDVMLHADETLLRQAFTNLIKNAAETQEEGGEVTVSAERVDGFVQVVVADRGPGIDEVVRERIFQPFFTTKDKGTGLGLAIVHRIVMVHGGEVKVESPAEGGTRFVLTFPEAKG